MLFKKFISVNLIIALLFTAMMSVNIGFVYAADTESVNNSLTTDTTDYEINGTDYYYGVADGSAYVMGVKVKSAMKAISDSDTTFPGYTINIPDSIKLKEATDSDLPEGVTVENRKDKVYVYSADGTEYNVTEIKPGAFMYTWTLPSTQSDDTLAAGAVFSSTSYKLTSGSLGVTAFNCGKNVKTIGKKDDGVLMYHKDGDTRGRHSLFKNAIGPVTLDIPDNVENLGRLVSDAVSVDSKWQSHSLQTINLGKGIKTLGSDVLSNCWTLKKLTSYVTAIGQDSFKSIQYVENFYFLGEKFPEMRFSSHSWHECLNLMKNNGAAVRQQWWSAKVYVANISVKNALIAKSKSDQSYQTQWGKNATVAGDWTPIFTADNVRFLSYDLILNFDAYKLKYEVDGTTGNAVLKGFEGDLPKDIELTVPATVPDDYGTYPVIVGDDAFKADSTVSGSTETIKKLIVENGVASIGSNAFSGVTSLSNVVVPSATTVGADAFKGTSFASATSKEITVKIADTVALKGTTSVDETRGNQVVINGFVNDDTYSYPKEFDLVIPSVITDSDNITYKVTGILEKAFCPDSSVDWIKTLKIEEGIETIGDLAFQNQGSLQTVNLPSTLKSIGDKGFKNNYLLNTVNIPVDGVALSIGGEAFSACHRLKGLVLPGRVKITGNTFSSEIRFLEYIVLIGTPDIGTYSGTNPISAKYDANEEKTKVYLSQKTYDALKAENNTLLIDETNGTIFGNCVPVILKDDEVVLFATDVRVSNSDCKEVTAITLSDTAVNGLLCIAQYTDENEMDKAVALTKITVKEGVTAVDVTNSMLDGKTYKAMLLSDNQKAIPLCKKITFTKGRN